MSDRINCPDCDEPISENAKRCPHCRSVIVTTLLGGRRAKKESSGIGAGGCLVVLMILGAMVLVPPLGVGLLIVAITYGVVKFCAK